MRQQPGHSIHHFVRLRVAISEMKRPRPRNVLCDEPGKSMRAPIARRPHYITRKHPSYWLGCVGAFLSCSMT